MHTEGVRQCATRTIVICEFSRYSEISSKSGGFEIEWFLVLVDDVNLLGEIKDYKVNHRSSRQQGDCLKVSAKKTKKSQASAAK